MRCKMNDKQKKFLLLRADGISFDKIAKELGTAKNTLLQWSKLFQDDINDLQFMAMKDLKEEYLFTKQKKFEQLLKHLQKIDKHIEEMDLSSATIKDLLLVRNDLIFKTEQMEKTTKYINTGLVSTNEYTNAKEPITIQLNEV